METRSFIIPASNKSMVEGQIEKLNKRARKLNLPEITLAYGKAFVQERDIKGTIHSILVLSVEVSGPLTISYEGWQFIATLQHLPTGENIIRAITDQYVIPNRYRECDSNCEHCKVKRYRKDTYLVRHDNNQVMQVGSTCIKDFLGGNSPDDIVKRANLAAELMQFMHGASQGGVGSNDEGLFHIVEFLAQTTACIRDHGWLSKSEAYRVGGKATAVWVRENFDPPYNSKFTFSVINDEDREFGKEAAEWVEALSDEECDASDYLHNIRAIARSGMVGWRTMGYAASIVPGYSRELLKRQPKAISSHVGAIKVREEFDLTLKNHFSGVSAYGEYHKYVFRDDRGNVMIWKASSASDLEEGKKYKIRGTVKAHTEYKGIKQTEINRCEVVTIYE